MHPIHRYWLIFTTGAGPRENESGWIFCIGGNPLLNEDFIYMVADGYPEVLATMALANQIAENLGYQVRTIKAPTGINSSWCFEVVEDKTRIGEQVQVAAPIPSPIRETFDAFMLGQSRGPQERLPNENAPPDAGAYSKTFDTWWEVKHYQEGGHTWLDGDLIFVNDVEYCYLLDEWIKIDLKHPTAVAKMATSTYQRWSDYLESWADVAHAEDEGATWQIGEVISVKEPTGEIVRWEYAEDDGIAQWVEADPIDENNGGEVNCG